MPELPEVECLRQSPLPSLLGRRVRSATLFRADMLEVVATTPRRNSPHHSTTPPGTTIDSGELLLQGCRITALRRHGKQLALLGVIRARCRVLVVHLGMTGQVRYFPPGRALDFLSHVHARWELDSGGTLVFRDPRRFGGLWALPTLSCLDARWRALGADALTIRGDTLSEALAGSRRAIKAALLDQGILAGVGNIYADEALFDAHIAPQTPAGAVPGAAMNRLAMAIRSVLAAAIQAGGSTISDYLDADGKKGTYQSARRVYGRAGEPCPHCHGLLSQTLIAQRTTTWCPRCQPHYRS